MQSVVLLVGARRGSRCATARWVSSNAVFGAAASPARQLAAVRVRALAGKTLPFRGNRYGGGVDRDSLAVSTSRCFRGRSQSKRLRPAGRPRPVLSLSTTLRVSMDRCAAVAEINPEACVSTKASSPPNLLDHYFHHAVVAHSQDQPH